MLHPPCNPLQRAEAGFYLHSGREACGGRSRFVEKLAGVYNPRRPQSGLAEPSGQGTFFINPDAAGQGASPRRPEVIHHVTN